MFKQGDKEKYYKGFRVVDGKMLSLVAWETSPFDREGAIPPVLSYKEGEITYAPEGSKGIFVEETLESCHEVTDINGGDVYKVIHEITPLGNETRWSSFLGKHTCYSAVLMGKRVESMNEPEDEQMQIMESRLSHLARIRDRRIHELKLALVSKD